MCEEGAFCHDCRRIVGVAWFIECDETGEEYYIPYCPYCGSGILRCYTCKFFIPESEHIPLGQLMGYCSFKGKIRAFRLICKRWREEKIG